MNRLLWMQMNKIRDKFVGISSIHPWTRIGHKVFSSSKPIEVALGHSMIDIVVSGKVTLHRNERQEKHRGHD